MKKRIRSFVYAGRGVARVVSTEANFLLHLLAAAAVSAAGLYFGLSSGEWAAVLLCFGLVMAAEAMNSAVERLVDLVSPGRSEKAGEIKDIAAGAVLLAAAAAAAVGGVVFLPKLYSLLG